MIFLYLCYNTNTRIDEFEFSEVDCLAKHEFGIMQNEPIAGVRYDKSEPQRYKCISVNDDYLENIVASFEEIDFYWHSLDVPGKGIAYCGITLIPPTSIPAFMYVIEGIIWYINSISLAYL